VAKQPNVLIKHIAKKSISHKIRICGLHSNPVELAFKDFGYNETSLTTTVFRRCQQNSYFLFK